MNIPISKLTPERVCDALSDTIPNDINDYIVVCVGTKNNKLDSFGPLVGTELKKMNIKNVYGCIEDHIHALNIDTKIPEIKERHADKYILAIDAALGITKYKTVIKEGAVEPGSGMGKNLESIGNAKILFTVAYSSLTIAINSPSFKERRQIKIASKIIAEGIKMHKELMASKIALDA